MSLPSEYAQKLRASLKREPLFLPELGLEVVVRGLTGGEIGRIGDHKRPGELQIALSVEDQAGKAMWDPNRLEDLDEIASLSALDRVVIIQASDRLSGLGKLEEFYKQLKNGNSSSPRDLVEQSPNSETVSAEKN